MLKESILFVAATGLLIYFIAPSDEPPEAQPVKEEVQKTTKTSVKTSNDGWEVDDSWETDDGSKDDGWGDDAAENESFTFGEPMTVPDGDYDEKIRDEEVSSDRQEQSANRGSKKTSSSSRRTEPAANSPRSGALGSIDNPIVLKTRNPPTSDDN